MWYESNSESILGIQCTELSTVPVRLDVFKPGALHPITPVPIKTLWCLWVFPSVAEKYKPAALHVVGDSGPGHQVISLQKFSLRAYFMTKGRGGAAESFVRAKVENYEYVKIVAFFLIFVDKLKNLRTSLLSLYSPSRLNHLGYQK